MALAPQLRIPGKPSVVDHYRKAGPTNGPEFP